MFHDQVESDLLMKSFEIFIMYVSTYFSVVPHITDAIQDWVERVSKIPVDGDHQTPEVVIVEV